MRTASSTTSRFIRAATVATVATITAGGCTDPVHPAGHQLVGDYGFLVERDDQFHLLDGRGASIRTVLPSGVTGFMPDVTADGSRIVFIRPAQVSGGSYRLEVATIGIDGSALSIVSGTAESAIRPRWAPGGEGIAYSMSSMGVPAAYFDDLVIRSLAPGGTLAHVIESPFDAAHALAWSPSGTQIAFERGNGGLWVVDADGSGLRQLTTGADRRPDWAPDGSRIAFERTANGTTRVCVLVLQTAIASCVAAGGWGSAPRWSPDGNWLALIGDDGALYTIARSGGTPVERVPGWRMQGTDYDWVRLR